MSRPIPLRDYVVSGQVREETVNALLAAGGEPVVSDYRDAYPTEPLAFRAFLRYPVGRGQRLMGKPAATVQEAADALLAKIGRLP